MDELAAEMVRKDRDSLGLSRLLPKLRNQPLVSLNWDSGGGWGWGGGGGGAGRGPAGEEGSSNWLRAQGPVRTQLSNPEMAADR